MKINRPLKRNDYVFWDTRKYKVEHIFNRFRKIMIRENENRYRLVDVNMVERVGRK